MNGGIATLRVEMMEGFSDANSRLQSVEYAVAGVSSEMKLMKDVLIPRYEPVPALSVE